MLRLKKADTYLELEQFLVQHIVGLKTVNPVNPVLIIVPSNGFAEYLQKTISKDYNLPFINVSILNLHAVALNIYREVNTKLDPVIFNTTFHSYLLKTIVQKTPTLFPLTGGTPATPGLWEALYSTIRDLTDAGINVNQLLDFYTEDKSYFVQHDFDKLLKLYEKYKNAITNLPITTPSKLFETVKTNVGKSNYIKKYSEIILYGFYDFTGLQLDFIRALNEHTNLTYFVVSNRKTPGLEFSETFQKSFIDGYATKTDIFNPQNGAQKPLLSKLLPQIFSDSSTLSEPELPSYPENKLKIVTVSGARDEIWYIAKEILRLVETENYKFSDIAVVSRTLSDLGMLINEVFKENFIPYTTSVNDTILRYPLTKYCKQLLNLTKTDYPAETIIDVLSSPYFPKDKYAVSKNIPIDTELCVDIIRRERIDRGWHQWESRLLKKIKLISESKHKKSHAETKIVDYQIEHQQRLALFKFLKDVNNFFASLPQESSWVKYIDSYQTFFTKFVDISLFYKSDNIEKTVFDSLFSVLADLKWLDLINPTVELTEFVNNLDSTLSGCEIPLGNSNIDGVSVLDIMSFRGMNKKTVFIFGLQESVFPRVIHEDPFLHDITRKRIVDTVGEILHEKRAGYREEKLLFYNTISAATDKLYLIYQHADDEGRTVIPSHYITELQRRVENKIATININRRLFTKLDEISSPKLGFTHNIYSLPELQIQAIRTETDIQPLKTIMTMGYDFFTTSMKLFKFQEESIFKTPTSYDGFTGKLDLYNSQLSNGIWPTELVQFGKCPFAFFISRVLNLGNPDEPTEYTEIDNRDLGNIYHLILEQFYTTLDKTELKIPLHPLLSKGDFKGDLQIKNIMDELEKTLTTIFTKYDSAHIGVYPLVWLVKKNKIRQRVRIIIETDLARLRETNLFPSFMEQNIIAYIGEDVMGKEYKTIPLIGRPDRVDVDAEHNRFRIIDYKLHKKIDTKIDTDAYRGGRALSLALYIKMVEQYIMARYKISYPELVESSWILIEPKEDLTSNVEQIVNNLSPDFWTKYGESAVETIQLFLNYIVNGIFFIYPDNDSGFGVNCNFCMYNTICRKNYYPVVRRVSNCKEFQDYENVKTQKVK